MEVRTAVDLDSPGTRLPFRVRVSDDIDATLVLSWRPQSGIDVVTPAAGWVTGEVAGTDAAAVTWAETAAAGEAPGKPAGLGSHRAFPRRSR